MPEASFHSTWEGPLAKVCRMPCSMKSVVGVRSSAEIVGNLAIVREV